jgi:hypothetical protein
MIGSAGTKHQHRILLRGDLLVLDLIAAPGCIIPHGDKDMGRRCIQKAGIYEYLYH